MAIIFGVTFLFVLSYLTNQQEIKSKANELAANPISNPSMTSQELQTTVDSLQLKYMERKSGLVALDSLLIGSDKWSRQIEKTWKSTGSVGGIWLNQWVSTENDVTLHGSALNRGKIADFARVMDGSIERIASAKIKDEDKELLIYQFTMIAPVPHELPLAAQYLRNEAEKNSERTDLTIGNVDTGTGPVPESDGDPNTSNQ